MFSSWPLPHWGYRLREGSKLLYRQPAFLICTDSTLSVQHLLQSYLWRWDIEVNFEIKNRFWALAKLKCVIQTAFSFSQQPRLPLTACSSWRRHKLISRPLVAQSGDLTPSLPAFRPLPLSTCRDTSHGTAPSIKLFPISAPTPTMIRTP
jgi:hypothetical protein